MFVYWSILSFQFRRQPKLNIPEHWYTYLSLWPFLLMSFDFARISFNLSLRNDVYCGKFHYKASKHTYSFVHLSHTHKLWNLSFRNADDEVAGLSSWDYDIYWIGHYNGYELSKYAFTAIGLSWWHYIRNCAREHFACALIVVFTVQTWNQQRYLFFTWLFFLRIPITFWTFTYFFCLE